MQILVNTDSNIESTPDMVREVEASVDRILARFKARLTRVEVHLKDESAGRTTADDIKCSLEARPSGGKPLAASDNASTVTEAVTGALHKLANVLESTFGRLDNHNGAATRGDEQPR